MTVATLLAPAASVYEPDFLCGLVWFLVLFFSSLWFTGYFDEKTAITAEPALADLGSAVGDATLRASLGDLKHSPMPQLTLVPDVQPIVTSVNAACDGQDWSQAHLATLTIRDLKKLASGKVKNYSKLRKAALVKSLVAYGASSEAEVVVIGARDLPQTGVA